MGMMEKQKKKEIAIKKSPKAVALEKVPDETLAMAIRDVLNKDKEKRTKHIGCKYGEHGD